MAVVDRFQGRLDAAAEQDLDVLVCLDQCDFIDSTGIAAIVLAHRRITAKGRRLAVCEPSPAVDRVFALTGLNGTGFVYPSTDAALAECFGQNGG